MELGAMEQDGAAFELIDGASIHDATNMAE